MVTRIPRGAPNARDAEFATTTVSIIERAINPAPGMTAAQLHTPAVRFRVTNRIFDFLFWMSGSSHARRSQINSRIPGCQVTTRNGRYVLKFRTGLRDRSGDHMLHRSKSTAPVLVELHTNTNINTPCSQQQPNAKHDNRGLSNFGYSRRAVGISRPFKAQKIREESTVLTARESPRRNFVRKRTRNGT